jgi:hypothetical protein
MPAQWVPELDSSIVLSARFHVATYRDHQPKAFHGKATQNKSRPRARSGKQNYRGDGEKESGWQHQQSSVFHGLSFSCLSGRVTNTWLKVDPPFGSNLWFRFKQIRNARWFAARV